MTWTQGQPIRSNQPPFTEAEHDDRTGQQPPVARTYTRANDRRSDYRQRQNGVNKQNNRSDVAATFTQEGLETFSSIFGSAVEAAIAKALPDVIERSLERSQRHTLQQAIETAFTTHLEATIERIVSQSVDSAVARAIERMNLQSESNLGLDPTASIPVKVEQATPNTPDEISLLEATEPNSTVSEGSAWENFPPRRRNGRSEEMAMVVEAFKQVGRPVRTSELTQLIKEVHWGTNPSAKITNLMNQSGGRIQRIGRGIYGYQELPVDSSSI